MLVRISMGSMISRRFKRRQRRTRVSHMAITAPLSSSFAEVGLEVQVVGVFLPRRTSLPEHCLSRPKRFVAFMRTRLRHPHNLCPLCILRYKILFTVLFSYLLQISYIRESRKPVAAERYLTAVGAKGNWILIS